MLHIVLLYESLQEMYRLTTFRLISDSLNHREEATGPCFLSRFTETNTMTLQFRMAAHAIMPTCCEEYAFIHYYYY